MMRAKDPPIAFSKAAPAGPRPVREPGSTGWPWLAGGAALALAAALLRLPRELFLLAGLSGGYGALRLVAARRRRRGQALPAPLAIVEDVADLPYPLRRLAVTQFLTWFGLFAWWIYAVPAIAERQWRGAAPGSPAYGASGDWAGVLFAAHDAVAIPVAIVLPIAVRRWGVRASHALCLGAGAGGLAGLLLLKEPTLLLLPAAMIGVAWASVLSMPYVIVADCVPAERAGVYMGIQNVFIVLPQLVAAATLGPLLAGAFGGHASAMLALAAASMALAAFSCAMLPDARHQCKNLHSSDRLLPVVSSGQGRDVELGVAKSLSVTQNHASRPVGQSGGDGTNNRRGT